MTLMAKRKKKEPRFSDVIRDISLGHAVISNKAFFMFPGEEDLYDITYGGVIERQLNFYIFTIHNMIRNNYDFNKILQRSE